MINFQNNIYTAQKSDNFNALDDTAKQVLGEHAYSFLTPKANKDTNGVDELLNLSILNFMHSDLDCKIDEKGKFYGHFKYSLCVNGECISTIFLGDKESEFIKKELSKVSSHKSIESIESLYGRIDNFKKDSNPDTQETIRDKIAKIAKNKYDSMILGEKSRAEHDKALLQICHNHMINMKKVISESGTANEVLGKKPGACEDFLGEVNDELGVSGLKTRIENGYANCESQANILAACIKNDPGADGVKVSIGHIDNMDHAFVVLEKNGHQYIADSWSQHFMKDGDKFISSSEDRVRGFMGTMSEYQEHLHNCADGHFVKKILRNENYKIVITPCDFMKDDVKLISDAVKNKLLEMHPIG